MAKTRKKAKAPASPMQPLERHLHNQRVAEEQSHLAIITPEQRAKSTYQGDGRRITNAGGTPIARWKRDGKLTDTQSLAIDHCIYLWSWTGTEQRITMSWEERVQGGGNSERRAINEIEARDDLHRIHGYIPVPYWSVFENVCRWDEPAGVAGSRLAMGDYKSEIRAHLTVCFVADIIHTRERL